MNSSQTSRTLESALCLLAALFPPEGVQVWNPALLWQPIPVYSKPPDEDPVSSRRGVGGGGDRRSRCVRRSCLAFLCFIKGS